MGPVKLTLDHTSQRARQVPEIAPVARRRGCPSVELRTGVSDIPPRCRSSAEIHPVSFEAKLSGGVGRACRGKPTKRQQSRRWRSSPMPDNSEPRARPGGAAPPGGDGVSVTRLRLRQPFTATDGAGLRHRDIVGLVRSERPGRACHWLVARRSAFRTQRASGVVRCFSISAPKRTRSSPMSGPVTRRSPRRSHRACGARRRALRGGPLGGRRRPRQDATVLTPARWAPDSHSASARPRAGRARPPLGGGRARLQPHGRTGHRRRAPPRRSEEDAPQIAVELPAPSQRGCALSQNGSRP